MFSDDVIPYKLNLIDTKLNLLSKILNLMHMKFNLEWVCFFTYVSCGFLHIHLKRQLQCEAGLWESLNFVLCHSVHYNIIFLIISARRNCAVDENLLARWHLSIYDLFLLHFISVNVGLLNVKHVTCSR